MSTPDPNYASLFGIHTVAGAIVFAVVYAPCVAFFAYKSVRSPTYVLIILTLFCAIREAAFIIRALLASSDTFGTNLSLYIADQVLLGAGFFGLLYSAYTLVLDRELLSNAPLPQGPIARITRNKMMFRFTLTAGVVLGIVGATMGTSVDSSSDDRNRGHSLRIAGAVIFLVLTVLQAYRTLLFTKAEHLAYTNPQSKVHATHGNWVLLAISLLLLIRQGYSMAATTHQNVQFNEALWYPLLALPEVLAVFLYATPGLVPSRSELRGQSSSNNTEMTKHDHRMYDNSV